MNAKIIAVFLIFATNFRMCQSRKYDNFSLYSAVPTELIHLKFLKSLDSEKYINLMFWKKPFRLYMDVHLIVDPQGSVLFLERAQHFNLDFKIIRNDIQTDFDSQLIQSYQRSKIDTFTWEAYHTLEDIYLWLSDIALEYPNLVELEQIGKSAEGRSIYAVSVKRKGARGCVVVEGGVHGSEWISTEFVTYLLHQLIHADTSGNRYLRNLASTYQWYLLPVVNPDGFDYSQKVDRLWRKNRRNSDGVDLNRNFDHAFGKHGSSSNPKDDNYCGPEPFSEPETKAFADFIMKKADSIKFFFSIHSYGQKLIIPYGDRVKHLENYEEMENYGKQAIFKMFKSTGVKYSVGTTYDTLGEPKRRPYSPAHGAYFRLCRESFPIHVPVYKLCILFDVGIRISGDSASWVKKNYQVKYVFTFLLRDEGSFGYALPSTQVLPTCQEALTGILEIMKAKPMKIKRHKNIFTDSSQLRLCPTRILYFSVLFLVVIKSSFCL